MEFAIVRISRKKQIILPENLKNEFCVGEKVLIVKKGKSIVLKSMRCLSPKVRDDLIFAERTERAWRDYERGKFKTMNADDFLKEIKKIADY